MEALRLVLRPHERWLLRGRCGFCCVGGDAFQLLHIRLEPNRSGNWKPHFFSGAVVEFASKFWHRFANELDTHVHQAYRYLAAYAVVYPIPLCALVVAKLLVLDRLMTFSKLKAGRSSSRWLLVGRAFVAIIVLGNAVGLVCNIVGAVSVIKAADSYAILAASNSSSISTSTWRFDTYKLAKSELSHGTKFFSIHIAFECIMLLVVVVAFFSAGIASISRIRTTFSGYRSSRAVSLVLSHANRTPSARLSISTIDPDIMASGQKLQRQILGTCSAVFLSLLARAVYCSMFVASIAFQNVGATCLQQSATKCHACNNISANMLITLLYTPQLYFAVMLISYPVTLLIALWGMTSGQMLRAMGRTTEPP